MEIGTAMKKSQCFYIACRSILYSLIAIIGLTASAQTIVYSDDFESGFEGWSSANWTRDSDAALPGSDGNYLHPSSFDNYSANVDVYTTSAVIDLTGSYDLVLEVDVSYDTDDSGPGLLNNSQDGFNIEYSANGGSTWNLLGVVGKVLNWYNDDNVTAIGDDGWMVIAAAGLPHLLCCLLLFLIIHKQGSEFILNLALQAWVIMKLLAWVLALTISPLQNTQHLMQPQEMFLQGYLFG